MSPDAQRGPWSTKFYLVAIVLIACVGAGWRFVHLGSDSLWLDEMITVRDARAGLSAMFGEVDHPPLLHVLVYAVTHTLGESEFTVRLSSAVAGVLAIPLMALLGVTLKRPGAGLWAALLLAVMPFHLRYSQDARNYALLMTFSLASYILLVQALTRPQLSWWAAWGVVTALNLYSHYSALIVLAFESILVGMWVLKQLWNRRFQGLLNPLAAVLVAGILYLPWLPRLLLTVFKADECCDAIGGVSEFTPRASFWFESAYRAFGFDSGLLPLLVAVLCIVGLVRLACERDWLPLLLVTLGLGLTIPFILVFDVARWPFPKYIIYLLPLYLFSAAVALDFLSGLLTQRLKTTTRFFRVGLPALVVVGLLAVTWPLLRQEHAYVQEDWKGITRHLRSVAREGDVFVSMALDLPNGFNQGGLVWPYYLDKTFRSYTFLPSNQLRAIDVKKLADTDASVWLVLLNRAVPVKFREGTAEVTPFQNSLSLVVPTVKADSALERLMAMYQQMIPMAVAPSPQCMLRYDLAAMYVVEKDYESAQKLAAEAEAQCPQGAIPDVNRNLLRLQIYGGLLEQARQAGRTGDIPQLEEMARKAALELLRLDVRDPVALALLNVMDLLQSFVQGEAEVSENGVPEPVQVRRFTMPQDGDVSDVLFVHAGASVSYRISLPGEPTALSFRAAMDPSSWDWGGDGSTFVVLVETESMPPRELYRTHISNDTNDRRWHNEWVSLAEYAGQTVKLTLATEPGPALDYTGDWAGWGVPAIVLDAGHAR